MDFNENWAFGTDVGMFYGGFDSEIGWKPQKQGFSSKNVKNHGLFGEAAMSKASAGF